MSSVMVLIEKREAVPRLCKFPQLSTPTPPRFLCCLLPLLLFFSSLGPLLLVLKKGSEGQPLPFFHLSVCNLLFFVLVLVLFFLLSAFLGCFDVHTFMLPFLFEALLSLLVHMAFLCVFCFFLL